MSEDQVLEFARVSIWVLLRISAPIMLIGLAVGLVIAIFQALTQIQEATLTFVPKILAVFLSLFLLLPFMLNTMTAYMDLIADTIVGTSQ